VTKCFQKRITAKDAKIAKKGKDSNVLKGFFCVFGVCGSAKVLPENKKSPNKQYEPNGSRVP
jgi:hypothetical protein